MATIELLPSDLEDVLDLVLGAQAIEDEEELRGYLLEAIAGLVPSLITAYNEISLASRKAMTLLAPADAWSTTLGESFARTMHENPLIAHYARTGDGDALRMSDVATRRDLRATAFYDLVFRPTRVEHQLAMSVSSQPGTLVGIALNRDRPDFTERERAILSLLRPHIARLLRDAAERRHARLAISAMTAALEAASRSVVAVGRDGRPLLMDDGTRTLLSRALGRPGVGDGLPAPLAAWLRRARRRAGGPEALEPSEPFTAELADGRLEVRLLIATGPGDHDVLVVERIPRDAPGAGAARLGLSRRQAEVMRWVAEGLPNAEIGERMSISPRTVQKHLENVFDRLGVRTRAAAVSRLLAS